MPSPPADRFTDSEVLDVPSLEKKLRIDFSAKRVRDDGGHRSRR
jgi:hypothetical protein